MNEWVGGWVSEEERGCGVTYFNSPVKHSIHNTAVELKNFPR